MSFYSLNIQSRKSVEMIDITSRVQSFIEESGVENGICLVFCPHTTAGLTINENADPDVQKDMIREINKIVPFDDNYAHMEGNSAAHIKATFTGPHVMIPVNRGRAVLGTWQGIYFCEYDGPRQRKVHIQIQREPN